MRCRFCSKSIPLLRRLSDAQFCSDAHRDAYSDEQKLAFERLMTTQAVGKTQRMPAYNQVAEIPQVRPPTQTMVAAGGFQAYFLDTPLPFVNRGFKAEPEATSLTVFFCEHSVAFPARFRHSSRLARVPLRPGRGNLKPHADFVLANGCRPDLPRPSTRPVRWEYQAPVAADNDPRLITGLRPVVISAQGASVRATRPDLLWLASAAHAVPQHPAAFSTRLLRPVRSLSAIAQPNAAVAGHTAAWTLEWQFAWELILVYPAGSDLRAIAEAIPPGPAAAPAEELNTLFEAFESQPLAHCRHLPALAAAIIQFGSPSEASMLPLPAAASPLPEHSTELAGITALPRITRTFAPRIVEPAAPSRAVIASAPALPIDGMRPMPPKRPPMPVALGLSRVAKLEALRPGSGARILSVAAQHESLLPDWTPAIPSTRMHAAVRLRRASITVYTASVPPAQTKRLGWVPEHALATISPTIPGLSSRYRLLVRTKGCVMAIGWPAAKQLASQRSAGDPIAPVYRPAPPLLRLAALQGGHTDGRTRCLPVAEPRASRFSPAAATPEWMAEPEIARSLKARRSTSDRTLQRPSNALFRIPNAQPLPKTGVSAPLSLPMSDWGSKPLMRPVNLRSSDGTDFEDSSSSGWRSMLREGLAKFGAAPSFGRLRRLPPDIKWIAMAVPLILGIWVVARPEGKASSAPIQVSGGVPQAEVEPVPAPPLTDDTPAAPIAAAEPDPPGLKKQKEIRSVASKTTEPTRWDILQAKIADRAAVDIVEDFRSGLSRWDGKGNWARTWSYDRSGTVRPGNLAIFEPTTGLRNYSFEMKAAVDKRVIQWLVRATDSSNYHVNRLIVTPDAAQTKLELQRWTVYKGRAGRVKLVPLPHGPANQTLFAIRVDVQGDSVTTYMGDQVIDTFSDPRLSSGGIGLAGAPGDQARVYAVRVSHQTDFLGKLCSFLAPQPMNMQGTE